MDPVNLRLALFSAAVLGFRHGLDYDHIAAITDISSVQSRPRDAMRYGLLYVAGHAATVAILGSAAVAFRIAVPSASDRWAERMVGIDLLRTPTDRRPDSLYWSTASFGSIGA